MATISERLRRLADEMQRHLGPPEMAPGPDADDLTEAADVIDALAEAAKIGRAYAVDAVNKDGGIDECDIGFRVDLERIDATLSRLRQNQEEKV